MRARLGFGAAAWAWLAWCALLADRLHLAEVDGGGRLLLAATLAGLAVIAAAFRPGRRRAR